MNNFIKENIEEFGAWMLLFTSIFMFGFWREPLFHWKTIMPLIGITIGNIWYVNVIRRTFADKISVELTRRLNHNKVTTL